MNSFITYPYPFETQNRKYLYDVGTNEILEIDESLFDAALATLECDNPGLYWRNIRLTNDRMKELAEARSSGLLRAQEVDVVPYPSKEDVIEYFQKGYKLADMLTIEVTDDCNLRCAYCLFNSPEGLRRTRGSRKATNEHLRSVINWYLTNSDSSKMRAIGFYGGEPLLCQEEVLGAIDYIQSSVSKDEMISTHITTNGTLLTGEIARQLFRRDTHVSISLDGDKDTHDRSRLFPNGNGSFQIVLNNLKELRREYGEDLKKHVSIQGVTDPMAWSEDLSGWQNLLNREPFLRELATSIRSITIDDDTKPFYKHRKRKRNLKTRTNSDYPSVHHRKHADDLVKGIHDRDNILRSCFDLSLKKIHNRPYTVPRCVNGKARFHTKGSCIFGTQRLYVDLDGKMYPCERVSDDMCIGSITQGLDKERILELVQQWNDILQNNCNGCWAIRFCGKCPSVASSYYDKSKAIQDNCISTQMHWGYFLKYYCSILEREKGSLDHLLEPSDLVTSKKDNEHD